MPSLKLERGKVYILKLSPTEYGDDWQSGELAVTKDIKKAWRTDMVNVARGLHQAKHFGYKQAEILEVSEKELFGKFPDLKPSSEEVCVCVNCGCKEKYHYKGGTRCSGVKENGKECSCTKFSPKKEELKQDPKYWRGRNNAPSRDAEKKEEPMDIIDKFSRCADDLLNAVCNEDSKDFKDINWNSALKQSAHKIQALCRELRKSNPLSSPSPEKGKVLFEGETYLLRVFSATGKHIGGIEIDFEIPKEFVGRKVKVRVEEA
jgi:hypothetical protein